MNFIAVVHNRAGGRFGELDADLNVREVSFNYSDEIELWRSGGGFGGLKIY
jgi:hypothetical protein